MASRGSRGSPGSPRRSGSPPGRDGADDAASRPISARAPPECILSTVSPPDDFRHGRNRTRTSMKPAALLVLVLAASAFAACGPATVKKPDVAAKESSSGLPRHAVEVAYGMWECERGYVMRKKLCVPEEEAAKEPWFEVFGAPEAPVDLEAPPQRR